MIQQKSQKKDFDVIVVGSGIAGLVLCVELNAKGLCVALVCKGRLSDSNTFWAQGGIAAVTGANSFDSVEKHLLDTLLAGAGLTDERVARTIIAEGGKAIQRLQELGINFDSGASGLELAREGGHSQPRVLHSKDASGRAISQSLIACLRSCQKVQIYENTFVVDLLKQDERCTGVKLLVNDQVEELFAASVVLATGGLGQVFSRTTNPAIATGDGIAMAYRAGAKLIDMEFVQFHPTALSLPGAPASLISEAVRGAGAHLLNRRGERFVYDFHPDGELATRDVVSRAIFSVMQKENTSAVQLDLRPLGAKRILHEFPNIVNSCRSWGIDPLETPVPVSPAAHYFMGGIYTDDYGRSSVPGLYAIGECASVGLHGANRLASNSLLEGAVMAMRISEILSGVELSGKISNSNEPGNSAFELKYNDAITIEAFRENMWKASGLLREGKQLFDFMQDYAGAKSISIPLIQSEIEAANIRLLGDLITRSAYNRCESRGAHWRSDYPLANNATCRRRYFSSIEANGWIDLEPQLADMIMSITTEQVANSLVI